MPLRLLLSLAAAVLILHQGAQLLLIASGFSARPALAVSGVFFLLLPLVAALRWARLPLAETLRWRPTDPHVATWGIAAFLAGAPAVLALTARVADVSGPLEEFLRGLLHAESPWEWFTVLGAAAVIPALAEEVAFRGFLQRGLELRLGRWPGILLTSLAFGLIHGITRAPTAFVLGALLGWIASRTGSILPTIVAHGLINALSIVMSNLQDRAPAGALPEDVPWTGAAVFAAVSVVLWVGFAKRTRQSDPNPSPPAAPSFRPSAGEGDPPGSA